MTPILLLVPLFDAIMWQHAASSVFRGLEARAYILRFDESKNLRFVHTLRLIAGLPGADRWEFRKSESLNIEFIDRKKQSHFLAKFIRVDDSIHEGALIRNDVSIPMQDVPTGVEIVRIHLGRTQVVIEARIPK